MANKSQLTIDDIISNKRLGDSPVHSNLNATLNREEDLDVMKFPTEDQIKPQAGQTSPENTQIQVGSY